jgi:hypothetical protein
MDHFEILVRIILGIFRIILDAPKVWANVCKGWECFTRWLQMLDTDQAQEQSPAPLVQNTNITPPCGMLQINVFDTI